MSEEHEMKISPAPLRTVVAVLQGGPLHGRITRADATHDTITMDVGNGTSATYVRGVDSPEGVTFNYVAPEKPPQ